MGLDRGRAVLVVLDMQERFQSVIPDFGELVRSVQTLLLGTRAMGVPAIATEQNPRGLGRTVPELARLLEGTAAVEKTTFAATAAPDFDLGGRDQVLLCGLEAHICVYQTAAGLLERGVAVDVARDAVAARDEANREVALGRIAALGGSLTSVEMALFELLEDSRSPGFAEVQRLVKARTARRP
jgi:nicotinamidase-related amidase